MHDKAVEAVALSVRSLAMDAVEAASSGHPGLPMGLAELGALIFGEFLTYDPVDPAWPNRDRFVLSAGHGSMFLYSLLHLAGFDVSLEDLKNFRQLGHKTPGHPEYGHTPGVETTTGPLGQGISNAIGMAIAQKMLAGRFNTETHTIIDHHIYALASDGDMMEGVASEACSFAGHIGLGNVIVFYDANKISIEGSTDLSFTEDVVRRFDAYGWHTAAGDAYDVGGIRAMVDAARGETSRPSLILLRSVIGKGAPNMAGTHKVHGAPLGAEEIAKTRENLGLGPEDEFYVHPEAASFFSERREELARSHAEWNDLFEDWSTKNPQLRKEWDEFFGDGSEGLRRLEMPAYKPGDSIATRSASGKALLAVVNALPNVVGGSADLASSNKTEIPEYGDFTVDTPTGRTLHFGVREHGMGAVTNGMALYGGLRTFCATFLVFSDYMRPSIRLAALMGIPVIYVFTHDSIYVGEDGPTHQPVEHYAALRCIPGLTFLRPADAEETNEAWVMALENRNGPTAIALTRQNLPVFPRADAQWKSTMRRGAYVAQDSKGEPEIVIVATGSEVSLALDVAAKVGDSVRVVSMPCRELFLRQDAAFQESIVPHSARRVVIEVGVSLGWEGMASSPSDVVVLDRYGASGPASEVAAHFGFTSDAIVEKLGLARS